MRAGLMLMFVGSVAGGVAGCVASGNPPGDPFPQRYPVVPGGEPSGCHSDDGCAIGQVCARAGGCLAPDQVYAVHVTWTLNGQPANRTTCDATPDLQIWFYRSDNSPIGYAPVPCSEGKFTIDKLPRTYVDVKLDGSHRDDGPRAMIEPVSGDAALDLPY